MTEPAQIRAATSPSSGASTALGPTCGAVSLTGGEQLLNVPAGTPINTLFNVHVGVSSPVTVGAGDKITLVLRSPQYYVPIQWSAPNGPGVSSLSILTG